MKKKDKKCNELLLHTLYARLRFYSNRPTVHGAIRSTGEYRELYGEKNRIPVGFRVTTILSVLAMGIITGLSLDEKCHDLYFTDVRNRSSLITQNSNMYFPPRSTELWRF